MPTVHINIFVLRCTDSTLDYRLCIAPTTYRYDIQDAIEQVLYVQMF